MLFKLLTSTLIILVCPYVPPLIFKRKYHHEIKFAIQVAAPRNLIIITPWKGLNNLPHYQISSCHNLSPECLFNSLDTQRICTSVARTYTCFINCTQQVVFSAQRVCCLLPSLIMVAPEVINFNGIVLTVKMRHTILDL